MEIFTDREQWQATLSGQASTEGFTNYSGTNLVQDPVGPLRVGRLTVTAVNNGSILEKTPINETPGLSLWGTHTGRQPQVTVELPEASGAISYDYAYLHNFGGHNYQILAQDAEGNTIAQHLAGGGQPGEKGLPDKGFFGVTTEANNITRLVIKPIHTSNFVQLMLDDLSWGTVAEEAPAEPPSEPQPQTPTPQEGCGSLWNQVYHHDAQGGAIEGSLQDLLAAVRRGHRVRFSWSRGEDAVVADAEWVGISDGQLWAKNASEVYGKGGTYLESGRQTFHILSTSGQRERFHWSMSQHKFEGRNAPRVAVRWFVDSGLNYRMVYAQDEGGKAMEGSLDDLTAAVRGGSRIRFQWAQGDHAVASNAEWVGISGGQVWAKNSSEVYGKGGTYLESGRRTFHLLSTSGQRERFHWSMGDHKFEGRNAPPVPIRWFVECLAVQTPELPPRRRDDLQIIEGIGPKSANLLNQKGISTFEQLAETPFERLREILEEAGPRFVLVIPDTWPKQAKLAAAGAWDELRALQDQLRGGRGEIPGCEPEDATPSPRKDHSRYELSGEFNLQQGAWGKLAGNLCGGPDGSVYLVVEEKGRSYRALVQKINPNSGEITDHFRLDDHTRYVKGMMMDSQNRLHYVVGPKYNGVHSIERRKADGSFDRVLVPGDGRGHFSGPGVDKDNNFFTIFGNEGTPRKYDSTGRLITTFNGPGQGGDRMGANMVLPAEDGGLYISGGYAVFRIQKLNAEGKLLWSIGEAKQGGEDNAHFYKPYSFDVSSDGCLFVGDAYGYRVQVFSPDGEYLSTLRLNYKDSTSSGYNHKNGLINPFAIALDAEDNLYVANGPSVVRYSPK